MDDQTFLDHLIPLLEDRPNDPVVIPWPSPANIGGFLSFSTVGEWHDFVMGLGLNRAVPGVVAAKFRRAQKLFLLGWIDADLIKAGELVGLTALELALKDRYGTLLIEKQKKQRKKKSSNKLYLSDLLTHMNRPGFGGGSNS
jgi:hypothetical protein